MWGSGTDGYKPGEHDPFHWNLFFGSVFNAGAGLLLLWIAPRTGATTAAALIAVAGALLAAAAAASYVSDGWRRYHLLRWWKKALLWVPGVTTFAFWALATGVVVMLEVVLSLLAGGGAGGSLGWWPRPGRGRDGATSVERDGATYEWNAWRGRWLPKWRVEP